MAIYMNPLKCKLLGLTFITYLSIFDYLLLSFERKACSCSPSQRNRMYSFSSKQTTTLHRPWSSRRHHKKLRLGLLNRRKAQLKESRQRKRMVVMKAKIETRNLKLYIENQSIIEENEKLRKKAVLLKQENQALLFQLQKKLSEQNSNKTYP